MKELTTQVNEDKNLGKEQVRQATADLLSPQVDDAEKAEFLEALSRKGETAEEIAEFVECFLEYAIDPEIGILNLSGPTIDICGTGGDKLDLFNISTASIFPLAAAGAIVLKHGNRGITSKSGGADVLEALGVKIELEPKQFRHCLSQAGVGFLYAPTYHPAFREISGVRKQLGQRGVKTIFNLMGPLLNPARPDYQMVGVFNRELTSAFAEILQRLGRKQAWAVNGATKDGRFVDEVSLLGLTRINRAGSEIGFSGEDLDPADLDLADANLEDLRGGDAEENAEIIRDILQGKETGPKRDIVLLNSGSAIACCGLAPDISTGIEISRKMISTGAAWERLQKMVEASNEDIG